MEIVFSIATTLVDRFVERLFRPVGRQFGYLFHHDSNIKDLKDQVEKLSAEREGLLLSVDAARRNGDIISPEVESWIRQVDGIHEEIEKCLKDADKYSCSKGFPNLKSYYCSGKEAKRKTEDITKLLQDGKFTRIAYPAPPLEIGSTFIGGFRCLKSRVLVMREIVGVLEDETIKMIGIWGMGGVGKTTMVKDVIKRVVDQHLFDVVVMAIVSQCPNYLKIQGEIAEQLGLKFAEENILGRAERLHRRITGCRRILVVIDDVWTELDFETMGIPSRYGHRGCKIMLTSRSRDVLYNMGSQRIFTISALSKEEAWDLFREMAGDSVESVDLHLIAKEVANECGGLPLAIGIVGKALKDKYKYVWEDALQQLKKCSISSFSEMQELVYSRIELSFRFLRAEEAKSCFLLCSLFPEDFDIPIEYLVRYGLGLDLFDDINTVREARNRVHALVDILKRCFLLLDSNMSSHVKMHDVVRDTAISIASKQEIGGFLIRCDTVSKEWPKKKTFEGCTAISVMNSEINEFPGHLVYPKLKLLQLANISYSIAIPHNFFNGMKELKVLALGNMLIPFLPASLQFLKDLEALFIEHCADPLTDISAIRALEKLEILSFAGSNISKLPKEIGLLKHLRLLDLTRCGALRYIAAGVLSSLSRLEELYMGKSFDRWESTEEGKPNASLAELKSLSRLMVLVIHIPEAKLLPMDVLFENLIRFDVSIGITSLEKDVQFQNRLMLKADARYIMHSGIYALLKKSEFLYLELQNLKNVLYLLDKDGLPSLKELIVGNCSDLEYLIDATDWTPSVAFPLLESLTLSWLPKLKEIWHGQVPKGWFVGKIQENSMDVQSEQKRSQTQRPCFGNLKFLEVCGCHELKNVFPVSIARGLVHLQGFDVTACDKMEEIVSRREGEDIKTAEIFFSESMHLNLGQLPKLTGFCKEMDAAKLHSRHRSEPVARFFSRMPRGLTNRHIESPATSENMNQNRWVSHTFSDGYNWQKYGTRQLLSDEGCRSYYKCTHPNCVAKKIVVRTLNGRVTEIKFNGAHDHEKPSVRFSHRNSATANVPYKLKQKKEEELQLEI